MRQVLWASVCAAALTLAVSPASAQQAEPPADQAGEASGVEEVVVTGQRQAYRGDVPVADIPQSITLLNEERLEEAGITRLADALDLSASVARQNNLGGLWESFAIRGLVGDENNPSLYLVNGFNAGRGFGGPRDVSGIERVEILKGPNAALFGRGEPGGSINLVTKRPTFGQALEIEASANTIGYGRIEADADSPITDNIALRFVGFYEGGESFRDTVEFERYGFTPSALIRFSPRTSLSYELEATHQEVPFDRGVVSLNGKLGVIPTSRFLGEPGDGPVTAEVLGHQFQLQHDFTDDLSLLVGVGLRDTELKGATSDAELAAARQRLFLDGRTLTREVRFRDYDAEHRVYRAELSGRFQGPLGLHRFIVGTDYDLFDQSLFVSGYRAPFLSTNPTAQQGYEIDILNPVYGRFPQPPLARISDRFIEQSAWGVYLQDQIRIGERLELRFGARYDSFEQDLLNRVNGVLQAQEDSRVSPQAGVVYRVTDAVSLYAAYGEGFRANSGVSFAGETFDPEESRSAEVGAKFNVAGFTGTVALFQAEKKNILTADLTNPGFSLSAGEVESRGVEFDLVGELPGEINAVISYAYIDAEVVAGLRNANGQNISPGDRLLNIPDHTFSAQASRAFDLGGRDLQLGAGVLYVSDRLGEVGTRFELPAYTTVRAFGSYDLSEAVQASVVVNNLFDEDIYLGSYSALWVAPGAPRNAMVTLRLRY